MKYLIENIFENFEEFIVSFLIFAAINILINLILKFAKNIDRCDLSEKQKNAVMIVSGIFSAYLAFWVCNLGESHLFILSRSLETLFCVFGAMLVVMVCFAVVRLIAKAICCLCGFTPHEGGSIFPNDFDGQSFFTLSIIVAFYVSTR